MSETRLMSQDGRFSVRILEVTKENRVRFYAYHMDEETPFIEGTSCRYESTAEALNAIGNIGRGLWETGILPNFETAGRSVAWDGSCRAKKPGIRL